MVSKTTSRLGDATIRELAGGLDGTVVTPDAPDYDDARHIWNHMIDKRPELIVRAAGVDDVMRAVQFARSEGLPVAVRGGAHSIAGFSTCDDGIVIDLGALDTVTVDQDRGVALAGGGTLWKTFDATTQQHGLATTGGLISSTGVGGFATGGGIGHLVRKHGLTCDNVRSAQVVTADGHVVRASPDENPDLYWALRGGGGNFGVVTSFELAVHRVGPTVLGGVLFFPGESAVDVVAGWRDIVADAPEELSSLVNLTTAPPAPFLPESAHFTKIAAILVCWSGDMATGEDVVKPLRALAEPVADLLGPIPYLQLQQLLDPLWERGASNYFTSAFLDRLPDDAVETFAGHHRDSADLPAVNELHIHHLGGAMGRVPSDATAFTNRTSPYILNAIARTPAAADLPPHRDWARSARDAMAGYGPGDMYVNFTGDADQDRARASYPEAIYARLQQVKDRYDPTNMFCFNQNIRPSV